MVVDSYLSVKRAAERSTVALAIEEGIEEGIERSTSIGPFGWRSEISTDASISRWVRAAEWVTDSGIVVRQDIRLPVPRNSLYSGRRPRRSLYAYLTEKILVARSEALIFRILRPRHSVRAASSDAFAINFQNLHLLHAHNFAWPRNL